ncbi:hypothetical protein H6G91_07440 [Nostoc muscorum FACHB-395]|jgi:hypothetical protein|nr:hypothetical protein [Desmonostoc muscorum FACHB-395]
MSDKTLLCIYDLELLNKGSRPNGTLEKLKPPCWQGVGGVGGWGGNAAFVDMQLFNFSSFSPHFPHSPHSKSKLYQGFAINKRAIRV